MLFHWEPLHTEQFSEELSCSPLNHVRFQALCQRYGPPTALYVAGVLLDLTADSRLSLVCGYRLACVELLHALTSVPARDWLPTVVSPEFDAVLALLRSRRE